MITVISGTNRLHSEAYRFAKHIEGLYTAKGASVQFLSLAEIPHDFFHPAMYDEQQLPQSIQDIQDQYFKHAEKYHFVLPEYNGSMPGALKLFLDAISVRDYKETFAHKKAALTGISSGRAGNLRGLDHLSGVLNFLGVTVMPHQLPVSVVKKLLDEQGQIADPGTLKVLDQQANEFLSF